MSLISTFMKTRLGQMRCAKIEDFTFKGCAKIGNGRKVITLEWFW